MIAADSLFSLACVMLIPVVMSTLMYLFITAMLAGTGFVLARVWMASAAHGTGFRQVGESSLSRNSINWLAGLALLAAIVICALVR